MHMGIVVVVVVVWYLYSSGMGERLCWGGPCGLGIHKKLALLFIVSHPIETGEMDSWSKNQWTTHYHIHCLDGWLAMSDGVDFLWMRNP